MRARRPLFLCQRQEGVGRPEGGGTAPPSSSWTFTRVWGALLVGARLSFPKSSATLAVNQARLSKEQRSWRSWSHLCRWGRSRGGGEAAAQRAGRSPCRLAPPAGDHLTAPRVSGLVGASTGRRELPSPLSAGHPCPGNQPPQGGCDKGTGRCCKARHSGPAGTPARRVSAAARAPGESS